MLQIQFMNNCGRGYVRQNVGLPCGYVRQNVGDLEERFAAHPRSGERSHGEAQGRLAATH